MESNPIAQNDTNEGTVTTETEMTGVEMTGVQMSGVSAATKDSNAAENEGQTVKKADYQYSQEEVDARTLCVLGLGNFAKPNQFEKWVKETAGLQRVEKIKKVRQQKHGFVRMERQEDVETAKEKLSSTPFKGKLLEIQMAAARNNRRKRKAGEWERENKAQAANTADDPSQKKKVERGVKDTVTPLWRMSYEEQLERKVTRLRSLLKRLTKCVKKSFKESVMNLGQPQRRYHLSGWNKDQWFGEACSIDDADVYASPVKHGYRNKSEFTISVDEEGKPCVGFLLRSFPSVTVELPGDDVATCPWIARSMCKTLRDNVLLQTPLRPYNKVNHEGFWRRAIIRHTVRRDVMLIVQVRTEVASEAELATAKQMIIDTFTAKDWLAESLTDDNGNTSTREWHLRSLYLQTNNTFSNAMDESAPMELLFGEKTIVETMGGVDLVVSPDSFLQVNTEGANVLYDLVARWTSTSFSEQAQGPQRTERVPIALDVCSGTGAIGLSLVKSGYVAGVAGVELVEAAVRDAVHNAERNGMQDRARYIAGRAELHMSSLIEQARQLGKGAEDTDLVAVVDPPRAGLHPDVQKVLRREGAIQRLVYVSCNAESFVNDATFLCRPASKNELEDEGCPPPFAPVKAAAVDLFPFTEHCELVVLLERAPSKELQDHQVEGGKGGGEEKGDGESQQKGE